MMDLPIDRLYSTRLVEIAHLLCRNRGDLIRLSHGAFILELCGVDVHFLLSHRLLAIDTALQILGSLHLFTGQLETLPIECGLLRCCLLRLFKRSEAPDVE